MEIFKIFGSVFLKDDEAQKGLDNIDNKASTVGTKLGGITKSAAKLGAALGAATIGAGVGLYKVAENTSEAASEINDMSVRTGLNTSRLQELKYTSGQVGVEFDTITTAVAKLTKNMSGADEGSKSAQEAFSQLGVNVNNTDGSLRSMDSIFPEVLTKLANMGNETDRNALAMDLFGKGAMELAPLLSLGGQGIADMSKQANDLGIVLNSSAITASDNFGDSLDGVKTSLGAIIAGIGVELMPVFQNLFTWILTNMPTIQSTCDNVFKAISTIITPIIDAFNIYLVPAMGTFKIWLDENMPTIQSIFETVWGVAKNVLDQLWQFINSSIVPIFMTLFQFISDNWPTIKTMFEDVFGTITNTILPNLTKVFKSLVENALPPVKKIFDDITQKVLPPLVKVFKSIIEEVLPPLTNLFVENMPKIFEAVNNMWAILSPVLTAISTGFTTVFDIIKPLVVNSIEAMSKVVGDLLTALNAILRFVIDVFKGDWGKAWDDLKAAFNGVWDAIKDSAKGAINGIISAFNGMIGALNKLTIKMPDWVPGIGGKSLGFSIPLIPKLAEGGHILNDGSVMVGERGPEILSNMKGATVTPLHKVGGITININAPKIFKSKDVDILGDSLVNRLRTLGVG